jgi:hypothetical protein
VLIVGYTVGKVANGFLLGVNPCVRYLPRSTRPVERNNKSPNSFAAEVLSFEVPAINQS